MAITFPPSPVDGDTFVAADRLFRFTSPPGVWESIGDVNTTINALGDLSDVTITSPADDEVLTYLAGQWVNQPSSGGGISDLDGGSANTIYTSAQSIDGGVA